MRRAGWALAGALALVVVARAVMVERGPGLAPWHKVVAPEPAAADTEAMSWAAWMAAESRAFAAARTELDAALPPALRVAASRFTPGGPLDPAGFARDWNRSFVLEPAGPVRGAAVMLHGLTDAPYSMRHLAALYAGAGFVVLAPRLPGHGITPGGLSRATVGEWRATVRMALRAARDRAGQGPIHLVGYSNGGALALQAALDGQADPRLPRAQRLVLLSPMVGVTPFARFAGIAGWPAALPRFAAAAWLDILPEFNPFKFNSFPVNAARQSFLLSSEVQRRLAGQDLARFPPVLAFQSAADATVSSRAVVEALFGRLPANGSELVLHDLNRAEALGPLLRPGAVDAADALVPAGPRAWTLTLVSNAGPGTQEVAANGTPTGLRWPPGVFSLSHVALPFPVTDGLYGLAPDPADRQGLNLGALAPRGERGVLLPGVDGGGRLTSNPFWPLLAAKLLEGLR
ncbi:alpha/beta hydrolase [Roseococcus sp. DSY-14]|uniref:alpha/beta hydrolase n=1 Tax=Roseococcus sp. DSY-14 TaxID=3369650 RepID=UPI00387A98E3